MSESDLVQFALRALQASHSPEEIRSSLKEKHWSDKEIDNAIRHAEEQFKYMAEKPLEAPEPKKHSEWDIQLKGLTASQILLFLGAIIVVIAGITYITLNWQYWSEWGRIAAIFIPTALCYLIGITTWVINATYKKIAVFFLFAGSLLVPLLLSIIFKELSLFSENYNQPFIFTVSLLTLIVFVVHRLLTKFPVWSFLAYATGIIVYFTFWTTLGVKGIDASTETSWLLMLLAIGYFVVHMLYDGKSYAKEGQSPFILGILVLIFSFLRIFPESFDDPVFAWLLLVIGALFFLSGLALEWYQHKKFSGTFYFFGAAIVLIVLLRLGFDGSLVGYEIPRYTYDPYSGESRVETPPQYDELDEEASPIAEPVVDKDEVVTPVDYEYEEVESYNHDIVGWSNVLTGVLFFLIAGILWLLKKTKLTEASSYWKFFYFVAPLWVLGSIWFLGLDGNKFWYESLLLIASLGFVFGSIPKKSQLFLYSGTLFLIVYIFAIGGEYFQNNIGWPITLFIAGILSMSVGAGVEVLRRQFFKRAEAAREAK